MAWLVFLSMENATDPDQMTNSMYRNVYLNLETSLLAEDTHNIITGMFY